MLYREPKIVAVLSINKGFFFLSSVKNRTVTYWLKVLSYMADRDFTF